MSGTMTSLRMQITSLKLQQSEGQGCNKYFVLLHPPFLISLQMFWFSIFLLFFCILQFPVLLFSSAICSFSVVLMYMRICTTFRSKTGKTKSYKQSSLLKHAHLGLLRDI